MEVEAIAATIEVLVQKLIKLSKDEISLVRSLDENAEKLSNTFGMIQSFLDDAQTKSVANEDVKKWLISLQKMAFEADNALDELNYQLLAEKVSSCFPSFYLCVHRRDVALRINKINTSFVESIDKYAAKLGLQHKLADAPAAASAAVSETDSFTKDPIFVGREGDVLNIVEMLTAPTRGAVSILPIVGMGGLGKTTLARNVFNHDKTKNHFGQRIWVHVSQEFNAVALLKKILRNVTVGKVDDESRESLLKKLREAKEAQNDDEVILLKNKLASLEGGNIADESKEVVLMKIKKALKDKTYLLVLDDLWSEDQQKWEDFIKPWLGITSTNGNGIIVTTRKEGVGALVKTLDMHLLDILSPDQCWSIIKGRSLEGGAITPDPEDIGRSIAKECKGLPLAANVVGGVLRGKSQDEWHSIKETWLSGGGESYISKILKLSFHHLSSPLKKCFAYCSIFPKGARINRKQLIELWMAEGFLQPSRTSDMEVVGGQFLKVLLHNSLLQIVDRDKYGNIKHCSMHDLVHDVAASISDGSYYKRDESSQITKKQAIQLFCWECNGGESSRISKVEANWLRTLIYNGRIADVVFSDFKSLHAITLTDDDVKKLPDSIRELIHLRYLDISDTRIRYLPKSIGELYHLQTIRSCPNWGSGLKKLPSSLKKLFNLRHLYIADDTVLPPRLGMLTSVQTLPCFKVLNKEGHRIVELESLKDLKGELKIYNLENVRGEEESEKACLSQKSGIVRLVLWWDASREGVQINDDNVLKGLQPHPNLKMLEICGFKGASFPTWTSKMAVFLQGCWVGLSSLMTIALESCSKCEEIPTLGHLPHLKVLHLCYLNKVKCIGASFYGIDKCNGVTITVFPALKRLKLFDLRELRVWEDIKSPSDAQVNAFPCLEHLEISYCSQLRSAPSQFTSLKELIIVGMDSELPLASICSIKLKTLTKLDIWRIEELICLQDRLFHNNQHLSVLKIESCPKLRKLPNGMHSLNSLEELHLSNCHNLKSASEGKLQSLASLQKLTIYGSPELMNFLIEIGESRGSLLKYLNIGAGYSDRWDCASFNKAANRILLSASHSLLTLKLTGNVDWESLPDQLQHLTALSKLTLFHFGIQELPEWFGNLSSLRELQLQCCRKLKHLPSVEAMRRLTNLTTLSIYQCPVLKKRGYEKQTEWPKISHLSNIQVDFHHIRNSGR